MNEKKFIVSKTMRYFTIGDINKAEKLLYVLHGYGQLASYFIKSFEKLPDSYLVIAPEGMHRFYLNGTSGRVGASWMTKEAREIDIHENTKNLELLDQHISNEKTFKKKIILGFSQGGATAARWYFSKDKIADNLILWASIFPPDISENEFIKYNKNKNYFVLGNQDPYFNKENINNVIQAYQLNHFFIETFEGKHQINLSVLKRILNNIKK